MMISLSGQDGGFRELFISEYFDGYKVTEFSDLTADTVAFGLESNDEYNIYTDVILTATVSGKTFLPVLLEYKDNLKRKVTWKFNRIDLSPSFSDSLFKVNIPEDCRVVKLTE
jgi:outer membrane lipoprotein-sorting protein